MSKISAALPRLRKRFMDNVASMFGRDTAEYDLVKYRAKMLFDKTVVDGKNFRSNLCLSSFQALQPSSDSEIEDVVAEASALLEMVQAFYLIIDDIMDESETRRGKICWHKVPGVGLSAINDALMIDSFAEEMLRQLYPAHPQIERMCESYRRSKRMTVIGQLLDASAQRNLDYFSWERYERLVQHKTSHYTIFHPIELALLISDVLSNHYEVRKIAYQIGFLFQAQDDILDIYGDSSVTGKIGTDIQDGKCTWVTTRAVQKLREANNKELIQKFQTNFGHSDPEKIAGAKKILADLSIDKEFAIFEKRFADQIRNSLNHLPQDVVRLGPVFEDCLSKLTNRSK